MKVLGRNVVVVEPLSTSFLRGSVDVVVILAAVLLLGSIVVSIIGSFVSTAVIGLGSGFDIITVVIEPLKSLYF